MPTTKYPDLSSIVFALGLLPMLVNSYDCSQLVNKKSCDPSYQGSLSNWPDCLVSHFGASAFLQCASQPNSPEFANAGGDLDDPTNASPLDVLTQALSAPECDGCPLAQNIMKVAMDNEPSPNFVNFGAKLCQINPTDAGMCCLKKNCLGGSPEHSIHALCDGDVKDLMNAPLLPNSCVPNSAASGDDDSSGTGSSGDDPSTAGSSNGGGADSSTAKASQAGAVSTKETARLSSDRAQVSTSATVSPSDSTQVSASATVSPVATGATAASATSTSPTPQATANTGAISKRQATFLHLLESLGVAVLSVLAVF